MAVVESEVSYERVFAPISGYLPAIELQDIIFEQVRIAEWRCSGWMRGRPCNRLQLYFSLPHHGFIFKLCERCGKPNVLWNDRAIL